MAITNATKRNLSIAVVCLIIVGGFSYYNYFFKVQKNNPSTEGQVQAKPATNIKMASSTTDWKEQFLKFSSLYGSSTDYIATEKINKGTTSEPNTLTDQFGRDFFTHYVVLKQTGTIDNTNSVNSVAEQLISTSLYAATPKTYSSQELSLDVTNDYSSYNSRIQTIMALYDFEKSELTIAQEAIVKEDDKALENIAPIIDVYQKIIDGLLGTPVPSTIKQSHLDLINGFSTMKFVAESFKESKKDPLRGLIGTNTYIQGVQTIVNAINGIKTDLENRNIQFIVNTQLLSALFNAKIVQ